MLGKIQGVVNALVKDPDYNYQKEAGEVKKWYLSLTAEEKESVKDAIMKNVDIINALKLLNMFGIQ